MAMVQRTALAVNAHEMHAATLGLWSLQRIHLNPLQLLCVTAGAACVYTLCLLLFIPLLLAWYAKLI